MDLPDPFLPRIAIVSPRSMAKVSPSTAATRRVRGPDEPFGAFRRNSLRRPTTSTAGTPVGGVAAVVDSRDGRGTTTTIRPDPADPQRSFPVPAGRVSARARPGSWKGVAEPGGRQP